LGKSRQQIQNGSVDDIGGINVKRCDESGAAKAKL